MNKYFINEDSVFAVNDKLNARVEKVDDISIVYIDDFYKNPDQVRDLALRTPSTKNPRICGGLPGTRIDMNMYLDNMFPVWRDIISKVYGMNEEQSRAFLWTCLNTPFSVNVTQSPKDHIEPHIDYPEEEDNEDTGWAGLIYLNLDEECNGGTGFYDEEHRLTHLAEMKYNRMLIYPANILHGAYDEDGWFKEELYRLVQVFFFPIKKILIKRTK